MIGCSAVLVLAASLVAAMPAAAREAAARSVTAFAPGTVLKRRIVLGLAAWLLAMTVPAVASAQSLAVSSLGQPGAVSSSPQPPVQAVDRGPCATPYELAQANGAPSSCGWPATGSSGWDPGLEMAGGDTLELRFGGVASAVTVTSTTNQATGVMAPDGSSMPNELWFGPVSATTTAEPGRWTLTLPSTPPGRFYGADGGTFAVLATVDGQPRAYSMRLKTPRAGAFNGPCGDSYFTSPGVSGTTACPVPAGGKMLPPGTPAPPSMPPSGTVADPAGVAKLRLSIGVAHRVRGGVRMTISATRGGALVVRGRLGRRTYTARRTVRAGKTAVTLRLPSHSHGRLTMRVQLKAGATQVSATKSQQL